MPSPTSTCLLVHGVSIVPAISGHQFLVVQSIGRAEHSLARLGNCDTHAEMATRVANFRLAPREWGAKLALPWKL